MKRRVLKHFNKQSLSCVLLAAALGFMFCVFAPLDAFFANKDEFWFSISQLLPVLFVTFSIFTVVLSTLLLLVQRSKAAPYLYCFLLYAYFFFYVQGNYVPRNYGVLNGTEIDWSNYSGYGIASVVLAFLCILLWIFSLIRFKDKIYSIGKYLCIFIILIQFITIGVVWIQESVTDNEYDQGKFVVTNKDMLELSENNNIIIFLLDTFDSQDMLDLLQGDSAEEYQELFGGGFTYYPDTLGVYPTTKCALPHILTGKYYYNDTPWMEYVKNAYGDNPIYEALEANGFSIGVYTEAGYLSAESDLYTNVDTGSYYVDDYSLFASKLYQLVAFNYMPHQLKKYFNLDTGEFEQLKETKSYGGAYSEDVQTNYAYLLENGVSVTKQGNCFRFYHTEGIHPQYTFGKDLVTEEGVSYSVRDEAEGNCTYLKTFFEEMKEKGVYDNSSIIVMADHGHYDYSQNPLFMIKNAGDTEGFVVSNEEMSFAYLRDIFVSLANGEKITEEYIRDCGEGAKRGYLYYTWDDSWERDYLPKMQEMYIEGYAGNVNNLQITGREYLGHDSYTTQANDVMEGVEFGEVKNTIYFYSDKYNADSYAIKGLSWQEDWGSWTDGDELVLSVPTDNIEAPFIGIRVDVDTIFYHSQSVTVLINGKEVYQNTIENAEDIEFIFENPGTDVVELTMLLPDSIAPSEVIKSGDTRTLGLGLLKMEVVEAFKTENI